MKGANMDRYLPLVAAILIVLAICNVLVYVTFSYSLPRSRAVGVWQYERVGTDYEVLRVWAENALSTMETYFETTTDWQGINGSFLVRFDGTYYEETNRPDVLFLLLVIDAVVMVLCVSAAKPTKAETDE